MNTSVEEILLDPEEFEVPKVAAPEIAPATPSNVESGNQSKDPGQKIKLLRELRIKYASVVDDIRPRPEQQPVSHGDEKKGAEYTQISPLIQAVLVIVIGAVLCMSVGVSPAPHAAGPASSEVAVKTEEVPSADAKVLPDSRNWTMVNSSGLSSSFAEWLRGYGAEAAGKIALDAAGTGEPNGAAYLFATDKNPAVKRVVWVVNHQVVYDHVGEIQGIAKVSKEGMSRIAWRESGRPVENPDGEGLLLVRDYTSPHGTTVFFLKNGKLRSGIPEDITDLDLR